MYWKTQNLHLMNGDFAAVQGRGAPFFRLR